MVVTGLGVQTAIGVDVDTFWRNALSGKTVVQAIPQEWNRYATYRSQVWSPLAPLDLDALGLSRVEVLCSDRVSQIALLAAKQAFVSSELDRHASLDRNRAGVFIGTGIGGVGSLFSSHDHHIQANRSEHDCTNQGRFNPYVVSMAMPNAPTSHIAMQFGFAGPARTSCCACASGTAAIGAALTSIQASEIDIAIAGGSEFLQDNSGSIFRGFDKLSVLVEGDGDNAPFDRRHSGFLFSQGGSAALILEELTHAQARGAKILAELCAYSETTSPSNMLSMKQSAVAIERMLGSLMRSAGTVPSQVDYINTHGTSTVMNDELEAGVIDAIFGKRPLLNSTKSLLGHTLGASGAIEAVVTVLSIRDQLTHISRGLETPIRELNFATSSHEQLIEQAISQSFAFGGHIAGLLFKRRES